MSYTAPVNTTLALRFLGVGNAHAAELGCSSAVIECDGEPMLMIDCGSDTVGHYAQAYPGKLPDAIFITHTHMDHIGGLESLFFKAYFDPAYCGRIKLFVPVPIIAALHRRLASPSVLAEGGANFWDCFQLIPVEDCFWQQHFKFSVFPVRHHSYQSAFGLSLPGVFLFTGDTRPIPEIVNTFARQGELIFHDVCIRRNPSHTCVSEIASNYDCEQIQRMVFYHYESEFAASRIEELGYRVARRGQCFMLRRDDARGGETPYNSHIVGIDS